MTLKEVSEQMVSLKDEYNQLTCRALPSSTISKYLIAHGNPCPTQEGIDSWTRNENQWQYNECILNNYDLCDFDRWQSLQRVLGTQVQFKTAMAIANVLYENEDIEIFELER